MLHVFAKTNEARNERDTHKELHSYTIEQECMTFNWEVNAPWALPFFQICAQWKVLYLLLNLCLTSTYLHSRSLSMHPCPPDNRSLDPCTYCICAMVCWYLIYFTFEFGCLLFVLVLDALKKNVIICSRFVPDREKKSGFTLISRWFREWKINL